MAAHEANEMDLTAVDALEAAFHAVAACFTIPLESPFLTAFALYRAEWDYRLESTRGGTASRTLATARTLADLADLLTRPDCPPEVLAAARPALAAARYVCAPN